ncbi:MAG TPA: hypothetical protein VMU34_13195 [Mycobacterium sp.]|nr:hypothetical protein [Mycobacterium sp.]
MTSAVRSLSVSGVALVGASAIALAPTVAPPLPAIPVASVNVALLADSQDLGYALYQIYDNFVTLPAEYDIQLANYVLDGLPLPPALVQRQVALVGDSLLLEPLDSSVEALGNLIDGNITSAQLVSDVKEAFGGGLTRVLNGEKVVLTPPAYPDEEKTGLPLVDNIDTYVVQPMDFAVSLVGYALRFLPVPYDISVQLGLFYDALTSPLFGGFNSVIMPFFIGIATGPQRDPYTGLVYDLAGIMAGQETVGDLIGNFAENVGDAAFGLISEEIRLLSPPQPGLANVTGVGTAANAKVDSTAPTVTLKVPPNVSPAPVSPAATLKTTGTDSAGAATGLSGGNKAHPGVVGRILAKLGSDGTGAHAKTAGAGTGR